MNVSTVKYLSGHRKHRYELADEPKKELNRFFIDKEVAIKVVLDCRTAAAHKIRIQTKLCNLKQRKSINNKNKRSFEEENIKTQYSVFFD